MSTQMPAPLHPGSIFAYTVQQYIENRRPPADLFWFKLPPFQRPLVWSLEQQIKFCESMWKGFDLGRTVFTQSHDLPEFDAVLIDGQQRLTAISNYLQDQFPVFGVHASGLDVQDIRRLDSSIRIPAMVITDTSMLNWPALRELYIGMNYGGTQHAPEHHPDLLAAKPK